MNRTHVVSVAGVRRELPIVPVSSELSVAFLKLYGDPELIEQCASALARRVHQDVELLVGPESGGILLTHLIGTKIGIPYVVARKKRRPNMVTPLHVSVQTIGTESIQHLFLDDDDARKVAGSRVAIVDEVVSSGGTLTALRELLAQAAAQVVQVLTVATEGEERDSVTSLCHLPVFRSEPT
ncbi:phosphoribosyltransferase family protein [Rathayibacter toxicus]|uniref:Phosphoribosyltransferase domain-containing protein n=1 Tax=Rathayibacter toxicus TaxID=145458 RepID=A0A0C5BFQ3_9MICO|nr:phosphoribosyltransferase family protein [Rathayibacter toxicus]AJM78206.1 hypothetical protein TI83_10270 [Rathayibacter toxicus]ALS57510.1 hypothetical protein APU90_06795 [Rathayibacter toxicus]KKM46785.1 hypothetical protein VT73_01905 [Rathayibacter toxicus]PPG20820.1 adenine phosphoribosyltransferase [Rathayibacter toxicus]PPG45924.1 adenine phosphoribosyltransferase [Rathayibacter toxicus]